MHISSNSVWWQEMSLKLHSSISLYYYWVRWLCLRCGLSLWTQSVLLAHCPGLLTPFRSTTPNNNHECSLKHQIYNIWALKEPPVCTNIQHSYRMSRRGAESNFIKSSFMKILTLHHTAIPEMHWTLMSGDKSVWKYSRVDFASSVWAIS